jgi:hypothetical protein
VVTGQVIDLQADNGTPDDRHIAVVVDPAGAVGRPSGNYVRPSTDVCGQSGSEGRSGGLMAAPNELGPRSSALSTTSRRQRDIMTYESS